MSEERDHRDELPADLDPSSVRLETYGVPNIRRRRISAYIYLVSALVMLTLVFGYGTKGPDVVPGFALWALFFAGLALYHLLAAYNVRVSQNDALVAATRQMGFPVGHASAQLGWRGLRSRPTWRVLLYSADEPPTLRGLVLVDGIEGEALGHFVEDNPEDWSKLR